LSTPRETFATRFGVLMSMIGVALGLGNVWRFPYMVGRYGGAAFVLFYIAISLFIGVPGLMAEWALGRETRRGTVGAFERGGLPFGKPIGWFLFAVVTAATAYYTNVIGWVLWYGIAELLRAFRITANAPAVLPPETGFKLSAVYLQMLCTAAVLLTCVAVLLRGLRQGIERISKIILPLLLVILIVLIVRALTLPGARAGLDWYILHFNPQDLTPSAMVAALGQAVFSLSLGGTFMVVYGSYLKSEEPLAGPAIWTTAGDTFSGVLAGLAIFPAVFALGLEPNAGPALLFSTIPEMFARIPTGWLFGLLFFAALFGAGYLSDIAALEVLIAGLTDNLGWTRKRATWTMAAVVFVFAIPPMINMRVFVPWDLTFGSGMQTFGALLAALTIGWAMNRGRALAALNAPVWLYLWIRYVIPGAILVVGAWWLSTAVFD
jgi:neurotransmitter:Na+ symporter, NSS family